MSEVKWIKLDTDIFNNRKIKQIESMPDGDTIIVIWFKLLSLAGKINDCGMVYFTSEVAYTDEMLATEFGRKLTTIQLALITFEKFKMIEIINDIMYISNWEKYQSTEKLEQIREANRLRQANYRNKKRICHSDITVTSHQSNALDLDLDKDIDKEYNKESLNNNIYNNRENEFKKPTLDEIQLYVNLIKTEIPIDCERFYNHYEAVGWLVGNTSMADWKAMVRKWGKRKRSDKELLMEKIKQDEKFKQQEKELIEEDETEIERLRKIFKENLETEKLRKQIQEKQKNLK